MANRTQFRSGDGDFVYSVVVDSGSWGRFDEWTSVGGIAQL